MEFSSCTIAGRSVLLFPGSDASDTIVYLLGHTDDAAVIRSFLPDSDAAMVFIGDLDWNRDLSPWAAARNFPDGPDFTGEAASFLELLTQQIAVWAESSLAKPPAHRYIAGYSLAGLFAVWSLYQTSFFHGAASMSGSLWFDGFTEYAQTYPLASDPEKIYLSLGGKEKNSKEPRMAQVENCTRLLYRFYQKNRIPVEYVSEAGGHFSNVPRRIARGIESLLRR